MLQELKERIVLGSVGIFSFLNMILNDFFFYDSALILIMMCYPPSGDIMFSLRKLKFYGSRGLGAGYEGQGPEAG